MTDSQGKCLFFKSDILKSKIPPPNWHLSRFIQNTFKWSRVVLVCQTRARKTSMDLTNKLH